MKKLLSAALAAVLTLSLAACSNAPETKEYTTEELSQILSSAISENSDGMADVITTDSLNAAIDWLTTNNGMSEDEANTFMEEYNALPYEDIDATLTEKGFTAEEIEAFQQAEGTARSSQMIFVTLGLTAEEIEDGALSI